MWGTLKKLAKRLLVLAGVCIIALAVALGGFRFLVSRLPGYQAELQAWVADELGLALSFDRIDLRWTLNGPQLSFIDAAVASIGPSEPFLLAREVDIDLNAVSLLTERELEVDRIVFEGIRLNVVRTADGALEFDGGPAARAMAPNFEFEIPEAVELAIRDSEVRFFDETAGLGWDFRELEVSVRRGANEILMDLTARPSPELGSWIELSVDGVLPPGARQSQDWRLQAEIRDTDLDLLARLFAFEGAEGLAGSGDLILRLRASDGQVDSATLEASMANVRVPAPEPGPVFDEIAFTAAWQSTATGGRLAIESLDLRRAGQSWPSQTSTVLSWTGPFEAPDRVALESDFLRLQDLAPLVSAFEDEPWSQAWRELSPRGDLSALQLTLDRQSPQLEYELSSAFSGLGVDATAGRPGLEGLSGDIRADGLGGRLSLDSRSFDLDWPALGVPVLTAEELEGIFVWRRGVDAWRLVSDDLQFALLDAEFDTSLELTLPHDGSSPRLDLFSRTGAFDALAARPYIPAQMPEGPARWLRAAILKADVESAELSFFGELRSFPFETEEEGRLSITVEVGEGELNYIDQWPHGEQLSGTVEFVNTSFRARGSARILGNRTENVDVSIADMLDPVLQLGMDSEGPLDDVVRFLNSAPLIAEYLGPSYSRVQAPAGTAKIRLDLNVPLTDLPSYELAGELEILEGTLSVDGFQPRATDINGVLRLDDRVVTGEGIRATFFEGPVVAAVLPPVTDGYRALLAVEGEVTAEAIANEFGFGSGSRLAGQTRWRGQLELPSHLVDEVPPIRIAVNSNLRGVAFRLPAPLEKSPGDAMGLQLQFEFLDGGGLNVAGNLGATRRFLAEFESAQEELSLARATVIFGGDTPALDHESGVRIEGSLPVLHVDDWMALIDADAGLSGGAGLASLELSIGDFAALGQAFGASQLSVQRLDSAWNINVESEPIAGQIRLPADFGGRERISVALDRARLQLSGGQGMAGRDPRSLPGLDISVEDFSIGVRRFGRLEAAIAAVGNGLVAEAFSTQAESFSISGTGAWTAAQNDEYFTRLQFDLVSDDVAETLLSLGFDSFIEGETARVSANVRWPDGPGRNWMDHIDGELGLNVASGTIVDIEPGAGRLIGLMSVMALPRRLALDFRDVFNKGFTFDEIGGDFVVLDGNAYTDNLKLSGPTAEIGIVGRTGLRDRDFQQQAVVTAEPSNMLPTVGGLIGGAGVGAALLIFTRIFKDTLRGIGRVSYCITGSWDEPVIDRLTSAELEDDETCAALPAAMLEAAEAAQP